MYSKDIYMYVDFFSKYKGEREVVFSGINDKFKFNFVGDESISNGIINFLDYKNNFDFRLRAVINKFGEYIKYFSLKNNGYAFYIKVGELDINIQLYILLFLEKIFGIKRKVYFKDYFIRFYYFGIFINDSGNVDLKYYKKIKKDFSFLPKFVDKNNVMGMLHMITNSGRDKKYLIFKNKLNLYLFRKYFDLDYFYNKMEKIFVGNNIFYLGLRCFTLERNNNEFYIRFIIK